MNMGVPAHLNSVVSGWPYRDGGPLDVVALHQQVSVPVAQLLGHRLIHVWEPVQKCQQLSDSMSIHLLLHFCCYPMLIQPAEEACRSEHSSVQQCAGFQPTPATD